MAQIAIKGHETRGKEVIEILEMLGCENILRYFGDDDEAVYSIKGHGIVIYELECIKSDEVIVFTLEEFFKKFPYKVGDKVLFKHENTIYFIRKMYWEKDKILYQLSDEVYSDGCSVPDILIFDVDAENLKPYKEDTMEERKYADLRLDVDQDDKQATEVTIDGDKITAPENYLIGKVTKVDNGVLVEFVKKQPQYPKTYEECCKVLGIDTENFLSIRSLCADDGEEVTTAYEKDVLDEFTYLWELRICRDAYWKIAGEQMGLGKPWEPMFLNPFLNFPTEEIRNAFYENFKDLIEKCKMLL